MNRFSLLSQRALRKDQKHRNRAVLRERRQRGLGDGLFLYQKDVAYELAAFTGRQRGGFPDVPGENDVESVEVVEDQTQSFDELLLLLARLLDDQAVLIAVVVSAWLVRAHVPPEPIRLWPQNMVASWKPTI